MKSTRTVEGKSEVRNGVFRFLFVGVAAVIQIGWVAFLLSYVVEKYPIAVVVMDFFALAVVIAIYSRHVNSAMKMPWIMLILSFPLLGLVFYLEVGMSGAHKAMERRFSRCKEVIEPLFPDRHEVVDKLCEQNLTVGNQFRYLQNIAGFPAYDNSDVEFFAEASDAFERQKEELRKAEHFIFMEYFAIEDAEAFAGVHEILKERAAAGVEVRLFYDDVGSISFINTDFVDRMEADGIHCRVFNQLFLLFNMFMNHRDHRKMTIIDGKVAFTGGYNLANEYFNITHPFGQWKDTGVMIHGDAVQSFTIMFLEMWNAIRSERLDEASFQNYFPKVEYESKEKGYFLPYWDSPMDEERIGENVYMNVLNGAERYAYFTTPYLIITDELSQAFALAAKRGVDVRIITPGIPDKKLIFLMTRSFYGQLAEAGVRIFEYSPGFIHAKQSVSDDRVATCGTINMDYRSLYHHFEMGTLMHGFKAIDDMKQDFDNLFEQCEEITEKYRNISTVRRIVQLILRLISPLA